jgi:hypothetical protein
MGSRKVKAPSAIEATPIAAQAKSVDETEANVVNQDAIKRRQGITAMYNRFGAQGTANGQKTKLGV